MNTEDPFRILDLRLAKGEITLSEYEKLWQAIAKNSSEIAAPVRPDGAIETTMSAGVHERFTWGLLKWPSFIIVLWTLSSFSQQRKGIFFAGYWRAWPEILGGIVPPIAVGGIVYGIYWLLDNEGARTKGWRSLMGTAIVVSVFSIFGASR